MPAEQKKIQSNINVPFRVKKNSEFRNGIL